MENRKKGGKVKSERKDGGSRDHTALGWMSAAPNCWIYGRKRAKNPEGSSDKRSPISAIVSGTLYARFKSSAHLELGMGSVDVDMYTG